MDVGYEEKRKINDFKVFHLNISRVELPFARMRKTMGGVGSGCKEGGYEAVTLLGGDAY